MNNGHRFLLYCFQFYISLKKLYGYTTIDMASICYQTTIEQNIIHFPKKTILQKNNNIKSTNMTTNYDVFPAADRFDPNMASSPPNAFINTLQQRMDVYYTNIGEINVGGNARTRALSLGK